MMSLLLILVLSMICCISNEVNYTISNQLYKVETFGDDKAEHHDSGWISFGIKNKRKLSGISSMMATNMLTPTMQFQINEEWQDQTYPKVPKSRIVNGTEILLERDEYIDGAFIRIAYSRIAIIEGLVFHTNSNREFVVNDRFLDRTSNERIWSRRRYLVVGDRLMAIRIRSVDTAITGIQLKWLSLSYLEIGDPQNPLKP